MTVKFQCDICHDTFELHDFRFLLCGHGFCTRCTQATKKEKKCAICRQPKGGLEPRQIYITFAGATPEGRAGYVVDGLDKIDTGSPAVSLERAARKIRGVAKELSDNGTAAHALMNAAKNLEERLLPLSTMLEHEREKRLSLEEEVATLTRKLKEKETESLEETLKKAQLDLQEAKEDYEAAASVAEQARNRTRQELEENARLSRTIRRQQGVLDDKDAENRQLQTSLSDCEKQLTLVKKKLRVLAKPMKQSRAAAIQDPDDSLQIEHPPNVMNSSLGSESPSSSQTPLSIERQNNLIESPRFKRRRRIDDEQ